MVLSKHVRMTENVKERWEEIVRAIDSGTSCDYLYCITMPSFERNLLDIHPYRELHKRKVYDEPFIILGLAESRKEAVNLIVDMVSEVAASLIRIEDFQKEFILYRDKMIWGETAEGNKEEDDRGSIDAD